VTTKPDACYHEAGKYVSLALKANPTITELLWLPSHETCTLLAGELIRIRSSLLAGPAVRNAYLGYATQQFKRLWNRNDGSFSSDTRKRTAKHARHLWRLLHQGTVLHLTGELIVRLSDDEAAECREFGDRVTLDAEVARSALTSAEEAFDRPGVLPDRADERAAEAWLLRVRAAFYDASRSVSHATAPASSANSPAS
jgi:hypothetical protein